MRANFARHMRTKCGIIPQLSPELEELEQEKPPPVHNQIRVTPVIRKRPAPESEDMKEIHKEIAVLKEKVKQIEERPQQIQNIINWNIVIGDNFYQELISKLGDRDCAIAYLAGIVANNNPIDVVSKLYLERRKPGEYPIACRDMHFKFVNSASQLIDDDDGTKICNLLGNSIQNALLMANNDFMARKVLEDREMDDESHAQIANTQNYVMGLPDRIRKNGFLKELSTLTNNPTHEFFSMPAEEQQSS